MKHLFLLLILLVTIVINTSAIGKKYYIKVVDDHEVLLISATDTISMLLENASNLAEETIVFVTHNKGINVPTGKTVRVNNINYPVMKTPSSKYYYQRVSAKTNKPYRVYLSQF